jgi:four helix bundle protein
VYRPTKRLPKAELYGLVSQIRRSGVSVASNIAEGFGRGSRADYTRFLKVARGSLYEIDTQLLFCVELGYIESPEHEDAKKLLNETERVLAGLIRSLDH